MNLPTPSVSSAKLLELASQPISSEQLLRRLDPPVHFDKAEFSNYFPEPGYPSQAKALASVEKFIHDIRRKPGLSLFRKKEVSGKGLYLDGGFGVGKTHLLAAAYHSFSGRKAYLSFQELMFLVGLESLSGVVAAFKDIKLLVIDELELDDPANTRITTNLFSRLFSHGVSMLASSNTPPGALGEGKFSVKDFARELGAVFAYFQTLRIDGEDYRHTHRLDEGRGSTWLKTEVDLAELRERLDMKRTLEIEFKDFLEALGKAHPMRIRSAIEQFEAVVLHNVLQIDNPHAALRFVYFIDKAYDNDLFLLLYSSIEIKDIFQRSYYAGGDTKKYLRTLSRLREMTQSGYERLTGQSL